MNEVAAEAIGDRDFESKVLGRIGLLGGLRRGLPQYYQALVQEPDPVLRVAAMVALLELRAIWSDQAEMVVAHCCHGAIKRRAFPFFTGVYEYEFAQRVADTASEDVDALLSQRMNAEIALDFHRIVDLDLQLFLAHGTPDYLWDAEANAEMAGGWRTSVPVSVSALLARPMDANGPVPLMSKLRSANQPALLERVCASLESSKVFQAETAVFRAAMLLDAGETERAATWLKKMPEKFPSDRLTELVLQLKGEALNKTGDYRGSYAAFEKMNVIGRSQTVDPKSFRSSVEARAAYTFVPLPGDQREASCLTLTGFPRSATTLLENVLEAHPDIEAFEEIPAFARLARFLDRFAPKQGPVPLEIAQGGRDAYYDEIRRQSKKPAARWRIDKLPTNSADAVFLKNIFPEKRYIFSIRHPYDVILSCFRQTFVANPAMENFRTIADAAALYDFTMTQWFGVHGLDDPAVCYVHYEELVNEFRPTVERVLAFIGADWNDSILSFSESADRRFAKTPSYKKVRSGISIGVQSSRQNYGFLFETRETAVLKKWVKHLGYMG
ncbi:MAG: sulfotransferase [Devosia sp.]|nr:sulfotransferase [Devosia sp.]